MLCSRHGGGRLAVVGLLVGLLGGLLSAPPVVAKAKACKKGFVRQKSRCVRKKAATTKKPVASQTTPTTAAAATKGTIKLGTMATSLNSATGLAVVEETKKIGEAWQAMVNDGGGINGYKVQLLYRDERGDNARALAAIKELDAAGVVALVGQGEAARMPAIASYLNQKKIPVIGGQPYTNEYCSDPMFFPVPSCQADGVYGQVATARDVGAKHFRNVYCLEVAACATSVPQTKYAADREGIKFSAEGASAVAADYTATCLSAKNAGVDFFSSNGLNFANVVRDCARQGYHPTFAQGGGGTQANADAAKGESDAASMNQWGPFYDGPEVQQFRKAAAQANLKFADSTLSQTAVQSWLGFEMARAIIARLTQPNPTRADFLEATYTIKGETLGGQAPPIDFTVQRPGTGLHADSGCWSEYILKDGSFFQMNSHGQIVDRLTWICGTGYKYRIGQDPSA